MRKYLFLAALAAGLAVPATASAHGFFKYGKKVPDCYGFPLTHGPRAAPWFTYWPYPAYFNAPAPTGAALGPAVMTPGGFQAHPSHEGLIPYPTNGFGQ